MKKREAIKNRKSNKPTFYYPAGRITRIPKIGDFPSLLHRTLKDNHEIESSFKLAAVTADFVYYADEEEGDETANIVMLTKDLKLVSDNVFASNDLFGLVENNQGLLWISDVVRYWQREQFVKPDQITKEIEMVLDAVDVEMLTDKEKVLYSAFLNNGPVHYSKAESLMAVIESDLDQEKYSDQLAAIIQMLDEREH